MTIKPGQSFARFHLFIVAQIMRSFMHCDHECLNGSSDYRERVLDEFICSVWSSATFCFVWKGQPGTTAAVWIHSFIWVKAFQVRLHRPAQIQAFFSPHEIRLLWDKAASERLKELQMADHAVKITEQKFYTVLPPLFDGCVLSRLTLLICSVWFESAKM